MIAQSGGHEDDELDCVAEELADVGEPQEVQRLVQPALEAWTPTKTSGSSSTAPIGNASSQSGTGPRRRRLSGSAGPMPLCALTG